MALVEAGSAGGDGIGGVCFTLAGPVNVSAPTRTATATNAATITAGWMTREKRLNMPSQHRAETRRFNRGKR